MRNRVPRLVLLAAAFLATSLALLATGLGTSAAQESITLHGTVTNGSQGSGPLAPELPVLLLVSDQRGGLISTDLTTTDDAQRFRFEGLELVAGGSYTVGTEYAGVLYRATVMAEGLKEEINLAVYETTQDVSVVGVTSQVMVVAEIDEKHRQVTATEFVRLANQSDRTLLPAPPETGRMSFLRFSLPRNATELDVQADLPGGEIISVGTGFALTSPVAPGEHAIEFSYRFPYQGDRLSFQQNLLQGAEIYQVMVSDRLSRVEVAPLNPVEPVSIQGSVYQVWEGREFSPGQGLLLELVNLPQPGLLARLQNTLDNGTFWQTAIPGAVGTVLAFLLIFGILKGPRRTTAYGIPPPARSDGNQAQRSRLVRNLAALDERYHRGDVPEAEYQGTRQQLKTSILEGSQSSPAVGDNRSAPGSDGTKR